MSHNTPFHQDNTPPPPPPPFPPAPPRTPVPMWAWGLGVLMLGLLITAIVLLGGRDSQPEATPAPAVTVTQTATPTPTPTPSETKAKASPPAAELSEQTRTPAVMSEAEFIEFLHETFPILKTLPDEEIMAYSADTCDALDDGATPEDLLVKAAVESVSPEQAEALGGIVGASVSNYCPKYYNDFTKFLDAQAPAIGS